MIAVGYGRDTKYITKFDDIREIVDEDVAEGIQEFVMQEIDSLEYDYDNLKAEFECYELALEDLRTGANETRLTLTQLIKEIDTCKRLDRQKIIDTLKSIDNNLSNYY